ncbi:unnamed protein product [Discosporangium mesarthrocarpum]
MAHQFGSHAQFMVAGADGQAVSLFHCYQYLEKALHVHVKANGVGTCDPAYVLQRLRTLAEDDFLSAYTWDKGGRYEGRDWTPSLATDAVVVMKMYVCRSDELLPKEYFEDRPFARAHFIESVPPEGRDAVRGRFLIVRMDDDPPHFCVVANGEWWETLPGPANAFQAVALFLYAIKTKKSGYLGTGISLGKTIEDVFGSGVGGMGDD